MSPGHSTTRQPPAEAPGRGPAASPRPDAQPAARTPAGSGTIDGLMDRASAALLRTDYFEAETLCLKAMERALRARDFTGIARITMPLQEARRQRRHEATDARRVRTMREFVASGSRTAPLEPGCILIEPPMVGADARTVRSIAERKRVPVMVLVREPTTATGRWPIVAVGGGVFRPAIVRVQVQPPEAGEITPAWFLATQEALGDAAIEKVKPAWPADHRVEDLLEYLEGIPDHEKLHQALAAAAREAAAQPPTPYPRRRGLFDDPFSF